MKRALLAGLLLLPLGLARTRAQETAYVSLVGMADSASTDRGPQAGEIPQGDREPMEGSAAAEPKTEPETAPAAPAVSSAGEKPAPVRPVPVKHEAEKEGEAPMVVPAPAAPRIWTRFFSTLLPAAQRAPSFEVAVSTSARLRAKPPLRATSASSAGAAQGFLELVATTTAP